MGGNQTKIENFAAEVSVPGFKTSSMYLTTANKNILQNLNPRIQVLSYS